MIKKLCVLLVLVCSTATAADLEVVSSGFTLGAFVDAEFYVNNVLVDSTPNNQDTDYFPSEGDYPDLGSLYDEPGVAEAHVGSTVYDPNNHAHFATVDSLIEATWMPLYQDRTNPKLALESRLVTTGSATSGNRVGLMTGSTSGVIYRVLKRPAGSAIVGGYIEVSAVAADPAGDHDITLRADYGDNWISAVYDRANVKWTVTRRIKDSGGNWRTVGGNSPYMETVNGRTLNFNETVYTTISPSSYTVNQVYINKSSDPRVNAWKYEDHLLANSVVGSGSNPQQTVNAQDSVYIKTYPIATVAAE